jgi:agmatinase
MVERIRLVVKDLVEAGKVPILLGGEHLITLGAVKGFSSDIAIINLDAHLDLRETYLGEECSHATFMRKIAAILPPSNIFYLGIRAVSKGELEFAKEHGLSFMNVSDLLNLGSGKVAATVKSRTARFRKIYLTFDMDVFDPAYAPGVGNPEADGLTPDMVLTLVSGICDDRVVGLDLVEVTPHYDTGITAALGARVIFEAVSAIEKSRRVVGTKRQ